MFGVGISDVGAALGSLNFIGSAARQRGDFGSALVFLALVGSARLFLVILSVGKPAQKGFLGGPWVEDEQSLCSSPTPSADPNFSKNAPCPS